MEKRILVISWFYPPINSSEGLVTFKLINNSKCKFDVFTQNNVHDWTYGSNVDYENNENVQVIFSEKKLLVDWIEDAVQYFVKNSEKYDIVMTRSMPQECHEVGLKIKKAFPNVTWIASFGDPISDNPYHYLNCSLRSNRSLKNPINKNKGIRFKLSPKRILYDRVWELRHKNSRKLRKSLDFIQKNTLKNADKIILNNESQKLHMLGDNKKYLDKTHVLRHSFDKQFYSNIEKKQNDKIRFVFVGHLDEIRNAGSLLSAIDQLTQQVKDLKDRAEFVFYGDMADQDKLFIINNRLFDYVKIEKPISYQESLKEMVNADWLIHIDGNIGTIKNENIFFAAKIADYFGSGTNIFAVTMQQGDVVEVLKNANCIVNSYSAAEIKNWLYLIIYEGYTAKLNGDYIQEFDAVNVAKKFDEEVVGKQYEC